MKGRLNSVLWTAVGLNAVVLCFVLALAYGAGSRSGGLRLRDFGILPEIAGYELVGAAFLVVAASVFLFVWLDNKVHKRVEDLVGYADRLDTGDYEAHANVTPDDFGLLAETFNRASEKLARVSQVEAMREAVESEIEDLERALEQIGRGELGARLRTNVPSLAPIADAFNGSAENLTKRVERLRTTAQEIAVSATQAHGTATNCATALARSDKELGTVVGVVDELAVAGRKISVDADNAAEAARHALDFADQGNRAVRDSADGMQRIRTAMHATTAKIKSLGDRSLEIYEIINLIHETNLLALNAVLEATRSGSGQSLEILAAEQRKLADHSRGATRDIVTLLKSIQAESNDAVVVMEQANRTAEAGSRLTDQASNAFNGIANLLRQTADLALTISGASRQQAKDMEDVKAEMTNQAQGAHRNAGRAEETLSQAEQVTRLCEQLNVALAQFRSGPTMVVKAEPRAEPKVEPTQEGVTEINSAAAAAGD